jgi:hypothetical protein
MEPFIASLIFLKGLCCSFADGVTVQDVDWDTQDGHYRVRIFGQWLVVPDTAIVNEPNRFGPGRCMAVSGSRRYSTNSLLYARRRHLISANRDVRYESVIGG